MSVPPQTGKPASGPAASGDTPGGRGPGRRTWAIAAAAVTVVVALALVLLLVNPPAPTPAAAAPTAAPATPPAAVAATDTGVPSAAPSAVSTAPATGPTEGGDAAPPTRPAVALNSPAPVGNGIVVTLPRIESIQGTATGPGNVNGPAVRVTVRIENGTGQPVSLDGVATNLYYGPDRTPASPLDDPSQQPFAGTVAAGQSAEAVYVFSVPADARRSVTVEVGYQAGAPLLLFTGPAA
jgi:hypothetical protein